MEKVIPFLVGLGFILLMFNPEFRLSFFDELVQMEIDWSNYQSSREAAKMSQ